MTTHSKPTTAWADTGALDDESDSGCEAMPVGLAGLMRQLVGSDSSRERPLEDVPPGDVALRPDEPPVDDGALALPGPDLFLPDLVDEAPAEAIVPVPVNLPLVQASSDALGDFEYNSYQGFMIVPVVMQNVAEEALAVYKQNPYVDAQVLAALATRVDDSTLLSEKSLSFNSPIWNKD